MLAKENEGEKKAGPCPPADFIQACPKMLKESLGHPNYKEVDYNLLCFNSYWEDNNHFISREKLVFSDYVGSHYLTGNELFCYPQLAEKLRAVSAYPILRKSYPVDAARTGMAFIRYFAEHVLSCHEDFQRDLKAVSQEVDKLINCYGRERRAPLIEEVIEKKGRKKLKINNLVWEIAAANREDGREVDQINLHRILEWPGHLVYCGIEEALLGTPFIAIRFRKQWHHKGQVHWYNLATLKRVRPADMRRWERKKT